MPDQVLTDAERRGLTLAKRPHGAYVSSAEEVERTHVARPLALRLQRRGLAQIVEGRLRVTTAGLRAYNAPLPPDPPHFLRRRWGTTTDIRFAVRDEPEIIEPPAADWAEHAEALRVASLQDVDSTRLSGLTDPAERLKLQLALLAERGVNTHGELRQLTRISASLDRKLLETAGTIAA